MTALRDARAEDAPALAQLLGDWVATTPWMPRLHSATEDEAFLLSLIQTVEVRVAGDPAEAFLARDRSAILQLQVARTARRRGLGRRLVREAQARETRLTLWTHQANLPAQAFWAAMGFAETHRTDGANSEEKLPDIRFDWSR